VASINKLIDGTKSCVVLNLLKAVIWLVGHMVSIKIEQSHCALKAFNAQKGGGRAWAGPFPDRRGAAGRRGVKRILPAQRRRRPVERRGLRRGGRRGENSLLGTSLLPSLRR
jgi:hypothetical protein